MDIEGIVLNKVQVKESDLIVNLLLRSGKIQTLYCYGGKGGGKKNKGSIFEAGYLIKTHVDTKKSYKEKMKTGKNSEIAWKHDYIRTHHQSYYLMAHFLEIFKCIGIEEDLSDLNQLEKDLFAIASNVIFELNKNTQNYTEIKYSLMFIFYQRILDYLGVLPNLDHCIFCHEYLSSKHESVFSTKEGGFMHFHCQDGHRGQGEDKLRMALINVSKIKISEFRKIENIKKEDIHKLFEYFCYQLDYNESQFKTWQYFGNLF